MRVLHVFEWTVDDRTISFSRQLTIRRLHLAYVLDGSVTEREIVTVLSAGRNPTPGDWFQNRKRNARRASLRTFRRIDSPWRYASDTDSKRPCFVRLPRHFGETKVPPKVFDVQSQSN
ncbi:hypothetical protein AVEN_156409-1 [Araneus ventricosus]|uniref:Uncharacterized protein n=1 Tax=Araneus ventricosus TaxID=182803 RepID=A0A4Y2CVA3_ARAVE|nr:hypothetical protein AVEN_156409-1 [Araneus ventricosus]